MYGKELGDVDLLDILVKRDTVYIDLEAMSGIPPECRAKLGILVIGDLAKRQAIEIEAERDRLEQLSTQTGAQVDNLCEHKIKDEFHTPEEGTFRCLVCGCEGSLSE